MFLTVLLTSGLMSLGIGPGSTQSFAPRSRGPIWLEFLRCLIEGCSLIQQNKQTWKLEDGFRNKLLEAIVKGTGELNVQMGPQRNSLPTGGGLPRWSNQSVPSPLCCVSEAGGPLKSVLPALCLA